MIFKNKHNNKPDLHFRIEIDDKHIEKVEVTKFLGVLIDNNLSWKANTNHITKSVSKYNGIIRKVRLFLNKESLHTLYNTLVLPYLTYCTLVWGDKNNANLDSLFITQKKVIRTCTYSLWLEHSTPLFLSLNKLKIRDIYTYQLAVHMYHYNFAVQSDIHSYNTRQALDFHIDSTNTKLAENTIKIQGPIIWNSINKTKQKNADPLPLLKNPLRNKFLHTTLMSPPTSTLPYLKLLLFSF